MTKAQEEACRGRTRTATSRGAKHKEAAPPTATPVDVPAAASGAQQAAYAKGLEDAAREFVRKVEAGEARSKRSYAAFKAALAASPLPPGSRVVVVPPDAVERMARAFIANVIEPEVGILSWDDVPADDQAITLRSITAALRALTGGDDRG